MKTEVKCCNCGWEGDNDELVSFEDSNGFGVGCPECKTDSYLTDNTVTCTCCEKNVLVEDLADKEKDICENCYEAEHTIVFTVIEDNGYGQTQKVDEYQVENISLKEAVENIAHYDELYNDNNQAKIETGFFYLEDPVIEDC